MQQFNSENFHSLCDELAKKDPIFHEIIRSYGYPPMWTRPANFSTLVYIILEQQVSLASAKAAFLRLKKKLGNITASKLLELSEEELKSCYFSRQKTVYARHLAQQIHSKELKLSKLKDLSDEEIRLILKKVKGIGDWTVDIYLLFALQRTDIFPTGDLAMMQAVKELKLLSKSVSKEEVVAIANSWRPYRSVATMLFWHHYLSVRRK